MQQNEQSRRRLAPTHKPHHIPSFASCCRCRCRCIMSSLSPAYFSLHVMAGPVSELTNDVSLTNHRLSQTPWRPYEKYARAYSSLGFTEASRGRQVGQRKRAAHSRLS